MVAKSASPGIRVGEAPFHRVSQIESAPYMWANIPLSVGTLQCAPMARVTAASPRFAATSKRRRFAQR